MLFGYEEWQNDWWLSDIRRQNELTAIDDAGHRALPLRSKPLRLLAATWEGPEEAALRGLLEEDGTVAVVRFSVKAGRFLRELASDPQAALHTLSGERVKDLNRLMVGDIEVVTPSAAAREC